MTIWKKAISVATSAALLASLLATAVAPGAFAATYGAVVPYATTVTEIPADGLSYITLDFAAVGADATGGTVGVTTTAGSFTAGTDAFAPAVAGVYPKTTVQIAGSTLSGTTGDGLNTLRLTAPTTAGTASVTVAYTVNGVAKTDSITTFTFKAATGTTVSLSYSSTKVVNGSDVETSSAPVTPTATGLSMWTKVADTDGNAIAAGAKVTWAITGPAYFQGNGTYTENTTTNVAGVFRSSQIISTGLAGAATITTKITYLGVTTDLATKTLTFVGKPAKVTAENYKYSLPTGAASAVDAIFAVVTDANGNAIKTGVTFKAGTYTPAGLFTVADQAPAYDDVDKGYYVAAKCGDTTGSATVTLKAVVGDTTVTSAEAVKITCATPIDASNLGTLSVAAGASTVAANSSVPILVTVKDKNGLPAPDGYVITAVTNGVGAVYSSTGTNTKKTVDGVAKFTYYAPANAGSATVTVFDTSQNTTPYTASVTILIGPTGAGVSVGMEESALGVTTSGPWSKSTKVASVGKYITWKIAAGSANANKTIGIFVQVKNADGTWGPSQRLTARVADSKGNVYFHWKSTKALWISVKGGLGDVRTNPVQGRWN